MAANDKTWRRAFLPLAIVGALASGGCREPSDRELLREAMRAVESGASTDINLQTHHDYADADLAGLDKLTTLERLRLDEALITDSGLDYVVPLKQLFSLSLSKTRVGDEGIAKLHGFNSLEMLWLDCTQISDESLTTLAGLPKLKSLSLFKDYITDKGLIELGKMSQLKTLSLDETQITDAGLKHLAGLKELEYLSVWRTNVTDAGVAELQAALPRLKINR